MTIAEVDIHPSYAAKCGDTDACDFTNVAASDAPDVAVLVLDADLDTLPTVPVDLDPVAPADPLLAVTASCATFDGKPSGALRAVRAIAGPAKSVIYQGSPCAATPQYVSRVASSYVVTAGAAWQKTAPRLCRSDIGAPLFRAGTAAVAGVTSSPYAVDATGAVRREGSKILGVSARRPSRPWRLSRSGIGAPLHDAVNGERRADGPGNRSNPRRTALPVMGASRGSGQASHRA